MSIKRNIYSLVACIFLAYGFCATFVNAESSNTGTQDSISESAKIHLTEEEKIWLANHPDIVFGYTSSFEPLLIENENGEFSGIIVDLFEVINRRLNTNFSMYINKWPTVLRKAQDKEIDGVLVMKSSLADRMGLLKTKIAATDYPTFYIRRNADFKIESLDDIKGKTISYMKLAAYADEILKPYKDDINVIECTQSHMPLKMVADGTADLALTLTSNIYTVAKHRYTNIDPKYTLWQYPVEGVMGIRPDWPILVGIINKVLDSFTEEERNAVYSKWGALQYKKSFNYALLWEILGGISVVIIFFIWSNIALRHLVKRRTDELMATTLQYRTLFESASDAICILKEGVVVMCNKKAVSLFGYESEQEFIGINAQTVSPELQPNRQSSKELAYARIEQTLSGNPQFFEWQHQKKDGTLFDAEVNLTPIKVRGKLCILGVIRDITEKKEAERALLESKKKAEESDRLKTAFLASLSHEIRTPMNGILGFADLLKQPEIPEKEKEDFINVIETSGQRMLNIINDLIDISKIEAGQVVLNKEATLIHEILDDVYNFFHHKAKERHIDLICDKPLPDDAAVLEIDKNKITQILTNLVVNAFKFTESGSISFGYKHKDNVLEFYVKDTGIGIDKQMHNIIFERFRQVDITFSSKNEGSGLGLSISKAFVEKHDGEIWVTSKINHGSTFHFTLPYKPVQKI